MKALMCKHLFYILKQITYDLFKYNESGLLTYIYTKTFIFQTTSKR
jgi:hypothetical protein